MESPGEYLKREREIRGITLEDISRVTKINLRMLKALEEDDHTVLPAPAFVKGFIRAYCRFVGLDGDDVVLRYEQYLKAREEEKVKVEALEDTPPLSRFLYVMIISVFLVFILALGTYTIFKGISSPVGDEGVVLVNSSESVTKPVLKGFNSGSDVPDRPLTQKEDEPLHLDITAREPTWIQIAIDNGRPFEVILKEGERVTWEAKEGFSLSIGNAGGVEVIFNGRPLGRLGETGQVVRLNLPMEAPLSGEVKKEP